jgi:hypothetical protein
MKNQVPRGARDDWRFFVAEPARLKAEHGVDSGARSFDRRIAAFERGKRFGLGG